jgi:hypothetical protein
VRGSIIQTKIYVPRRRGASIPEAVLNPEQWRMADVGHDAAANVE